MDNLSQVTVPVLNAKKIQKSFRHSKIMNEMLEAVSYVRKEKTTSTMHELDKIKSCHECDIPVNISILWSQTFLTIISIIRCSVQLFLYEFKM